MPSRRGSIAMFLVKWLVVPLALAAIGFFIVGPMIGRPVPPPEGASQAQAPTEEPNSPKVTGDPEVEVSARPASRRRPARRSSRPRTQPREERPEEVPSPDEDPPGSGPDIG